MLQLQTDFALYVRGVMLRALPILHDRILLGYYLSCHGVIHNFDSQLILDIEMFLFVL